MATATIKQSTAPRDGDRPRATPDPAPAANAGSHQGEGCLQGLIAKRLAAATEAALDGPNQTLMNAQKPVWKAICDYYFRLEISGWEADATNGRATPPRMKLLCQAPPCKMVARGHRSPSRDAATPLALLGPVGPPLTARRPRGVLH